MAGAGRASVDAKKKTRAAAEADPLKRQEFAARQRGLPAERLVFVDEFSLHTALTPEYGRAPSGQRVVTSEPFERERVSVIAALTLCGVAAPCTLPGAFDTDAFDAWVGAALLPVLFPGDIVILDNVRFHFAGRAGQLIAAAGCRVVPLPPYSPDFNPIENCISKIKQFLRQAKARTLRKLYRALRQAIETITPDDIAAWFVHCGYIYSSD